MFAPCSDSFTCIQLVQGRNCVYWCCKNSGHCVSVLDVRGQRVQTFGSQDDRPEQMIYPAGIAVDDVDNIYVSSKHKL